MKQHLTVTLPLRPDGVFYQNAMDLKYAVCHYFVETVFGVEPGTRKITVSLSKTRTGKNGWRLINTTAGYGQDVAVSGQAFPEVSTSSQRELLESLGFNPSRFWMKITPA